MTQGPAHKELILQLVMHRLRARSRENHLGEWNMRAYIRLFVLMVNAGRDHSRWITL